MRKKWCLTGTDIETMISACRQEAEKDDLKPTIAIVDDGGHLLYLERPDSQSPLGIEMATGKARTAAFRERPSRALADRVKERPGFLMMPDCLPVPAGIPLFYQGVCVGGIGVSSIAEHDEPVAMAGAAALEQVGK